MAGNVLVHDIALMETGLFIEAVYRQFGCDFRGFDKLVMKHKLELLTGRCGAENISALQGRVLRDRALARETFRLLSVSATSFLTTPSSFMALRCAVLPVLRSASWPVIWIAECADPGIVVQMAVMLAEEGLSGKTQLFITNPNEEVLNEVARLRLDAQTMPARDAAHLRGGGLRSLVEYCDVYRDESSDDSSDESSDDAVGGFSLRAALRDNIVWSQYDLASDASFKEFDLVVCQRPLGEFEITLQRRALDIFGKSLCNFGILQIESPSVLLSADLARDFVSILPEQGIYRRSPAAVLALL